MYRKPVSRKTSQPSRVFAAASIYRVDNGSHVSSRGSTTFTDPPTGSWSHTFTISENV